MPILTTTLLAIAAAGAAQLGSERLLACAADRHRAANGPDPAAAKGSASAIGRAARLRAQANDYRHRAETALAAERGLSPADAAADIAARYPRLAIGRGPAVRC